MHIINSGTFLFRNKVASLLVNEKTTYIHALVGKPSVQHCLHNIKLLVTELA